MPAHARLDTRVWTQKAPTSVAATRSPVDEAITWVRTAHTVKVKSATREHFFLFYHLTDLLSAFLVADVDECRRGNVCGNHGCLNLVGTYRCECTDGFIFNSVAKLCEGTAGMVFLLRSLFCAHQPWNHIIISALFTNIMMPPHKLLPQILHLCVIIQNPILTLAKISHLVLFFKSHVSFPFLHRKEYKSVTSLLLFWYPDVLLSLPQLLF